MTDAATRAAALLREHRESIDRLDAILVYTLAERFKHTQYRRAAEGRTRPDPRRIRRGKRRRSNAWAASRMRPTSTRNSRGNS